MKDIWVVRKGKTSQRTILFRQNINRDNEEWAHFLEGYRKWLMFWDMKEYGDDWHTAEDVVSEIFLAIILEPLITNLRPSDSFRHALITLCKQKHRDFTKPWRKQLVEKLKRSLQPRPRSRGDSRRAAALGLCNLVRADLMDAERDGRRAFTTFSQEDLRRWRKLRLAQKSAAGNPTAGDAARRLNVTRTALSKSCKKVDAHVVEKVKTIMKRNRI